MFEKIGRAAEQMAGKVGVSRRGFLGRLGRGALAAAGVVGAVLVLPRESQARSRCCAYGCYNGSQFVVMGPCKKIPGCGGHEVPC
jgi:hypothetical protein